MSSPSRFEVAADAINKHVGAYVPENAVDLERFLAGLPLLIEAIAQSVGKVANVLTADWPVDPAVPEHLSEIAATTAGMGDFATETHTIFRTAHAEDPDHTENPSLADPEFMDGTEPSSEGGGASGDEAPIAEGDVATDGSEMPEPDLSFAGVKPARKDVANEKSMFKYYGGWESRDSSLENYGTAIFNGDLSGKSLGDIIQERVGEDPGAVGIDVLAGPNGVALKELMELGVIGIGVTIDNEHESGRNPDNSMHHVSGDILQEQTWKDIIAK
jgi:hypothetical protein